MIKTQLKSRVHLRAFERLQKIHLLIADGNYPNTQRLAEGLGVNARTIKRDITALRDRFNAPLDFDRFQNGFYYTHRNWQLPLLPLTDEELFAFFLNVLLLEGQARVFREPQLQKAMAKIAVRLPEEIFVQLSFLLDNLSVESIPHATRSAIVLEKLASAASARRTVEFDYYSQHRGETKHRQADPLLLHNFEGDWYLVAFDHLRGKPIDFHTARISNLQETDSFFKPPRKWNKAEYLKPGFSMYRGGRLTEVSILFDAYQAQWITEKSLVHQTETRERLPDGSLRLKFKIGANGLEGVARYCLKYAGNCRVEAPKKLRRMMREKLEKALAAHID
jgi:predicted DNA-binding transcriptional regulator YafY